MSGIKGAPVESPESPTLSSVQKLIFSIGHLKFSMRAISSMHLQSTLLSQNKSESTSKLKPLESNRLLENIINEISVRKQNECSENTGACKTDKAGSSISIDDLEEVQKKLQEELEMKRQNYLESISKKCNV